MDILDINCDLGEGFDNEEELMPYIQSCNIACRGHAGNEKSMRKIVAMAIKYKVKIGAHPSYPDKVNFGRKSMKLEDELFIQMVQNQIESLEKPGRKTCQAFLFIQHSHFTILLFTAKYIKNK